MENVLQLAPRCLLIMLVPFALFFFGVFFTALVTERRRKREQTRAVLAMLRPDAEEQTVSRYAYAIEQQQREPMLHTRIQPVYFRGRKITPHHL
jgi:hypothetical protein